MSDDRQDRVLWEAEFDRRVRVYWLLSGAWILAVTILGIPLIPIWFAVGLAVTEHYLKRMRCVLTEKSLAVGKGILFRVEKTVPLDKITDVGLAQGPLMRHFGLETLTVETAGQSSQGALLKLIGVVETRRFRDAVLRQRDAVAAARAEEALAPSGSRVADAVPEAAILTDIRDTLHRIERRLPPAGRVDAS